MRTKEEFEEEMKERQKKNLILFEGNTNETIKLLI